MIERKRIIELAQERIDELDKGLYIVDATVSPSNAINVEIDCMEGGVAIVDCMSISRNIEHNQEEDVEFELLVSSPGLDKPFKVQQQYIKNIGKDVTVIFKEHGSITGTLKEVDDNKILVETSSKERLEGKKKKVLVVKQNEIPFSQIKETRVVISFK